ncbi:unnamed protein product, partial [Ectocarpus sp. 12 AP-2014]
MPQTDSRRRNILSMTSARKGDKCKEEWSVRPAQSGRARALGGLVGCRNIYTVRRSVLPPGHRSCSLGCCCSVVQRKPRNKPTIEVPIAVRTWREGASLGCIPTFGRLGGLGTRKEMMSHAPALPQGFRLWSPQ